MAILNSKPHHEADPTAIEKIMKNQKTIIYPRGLSITWGNDSRYWRLPRKNNNTSSAVAELLQVSWLEVTCSTDNVEPGKTYKVGFNVSMKPDAFGWKRCEVYIMAKIGKMGKFIYKKVSDLAVKSADQKFNIPEDDLEITVKAPLNSAGDHMLYFGMYEVWSENWKGGMRIHHAFVEKVVN